MKCKFVQDDDCHWYMIPADMETLFHQMLENGEADYWCEFNNKWEDYRCDHPSCYTVVYFGLEE